MSRYDDYRANTPHVAELHPELSAGLDRLDAVHDWHFETLKALMGTNGPGRDTPLFDVDIVIMSILNRSLDLIDGFRWAFHRWNLSTAAPLVRLQVDNLLRLNLLSVAPAGSVTPLLLGDAPLRKVRDPLAADGAKVKLTDQRLREHAAERFPWLSVVYERASGWVHFSDVHIGMTLDVSSDGAVSAHFPPDVTRYPADFLEQVLWAMIEASSGIVEIAAWFASGKKQASDEWSDSE